MVPLCLVQSVVVRPSVTSLTRIVVGSSLACLASFLGLVRLERTHDVPLTEVGVFDDEEIRGRMAWR